MPPDVRRAAEADFAALAAMDLTYSTKRYLALKRAGDPPELAFSFEWRDGEPGEAVYHHYTEEGSRHALETGADLFLVAEVERQVAGLLMVVLPKWTDAGEITDLAVDRRFRRHGAGRALVLAAADWARERNIRALWVEPRANFAGAIEFYLSMGFRFSGFSDRLYSNADQEDGRPTLYMHLELDGTSM